MAKAACSSCGKQVFRGPDSRPEIICQECRRKSPAYQKRQARPQRRAGPATCSICGNGFQQSMGGQKYCSLSCRNRRPRNCSEAARARRREGERQRSKTRPRLQGRRAITKPCEHCGEEFASRPVDNQRYCSGSCRSKAHRREWVSSTLTYRDCPECGRLFIGRGGRKSCGDECAQRQRRRRDLVRYGKTLEQVDACRACSQPKPLGRKLCDPCLDQAEKDGKRRARRRRRARERGARCEPYTLAYLAERDRYRCGLCGKRVAMSKPVPHPKAPTVDHIIPLSDGGDDVKANVQLAHFICNSIKSARASGEQLMLIG